MALSLDQLKAAFKKPEQAEGGGRPNNYYPFWNMEDGQQAVIRFLPDKNQNNPLGFLVEKLMHTLEVNGEKKSTPCLKMYGEDCPICKVSSAYYKAEDKVNGKKYWRKKQHIAQALILEDPLKADDTGETHAGKVRFLALGYQLFNIIKEAFENGEMDDVPYSLEDGYDFIIKKTKQGDYSTYTVGSRFRAKARALTAAELEIVEDNLSDLASLLPQNVGEEKTSALLSAALNGSVYSAPEGRNGRASKDSTKTLEARIPAPSLSSDDDDNIPFEDTPVASKATPTVDASVDSEAEDILASIRNRMKKKAE
jgi:hypothetical protein